MQRTLITLVIFLISQVGFSQDLTYKNELVSLAKIYKKFHFGSDPTTSYYKKINSVSNNKLNHAKQLISEIVTSNNNLLTEKYLSKPDSITLKSLYIIRGVNWNLHEAEAKNNLKVVDSLLNEKTDYNELVSCYYGMIFSGVGNKNRPFDLSTINFELENYNLQNDTEKGIFFLTSMRTFGMMIWGYINVPKPPNYKKALSYIRKYPKYEGLEYYRFTDLNFEDFKLTIDKRKPKQSYKEYYIDKYIETLLYHSMCLSKKKKYRKEKLLLESILKNNSYWKYTEYKPTLEKIFKRVKT
ncbi:hypothetical protein [Tenacibaculum sp. 190524A05c]|uniref:hypothetical protein n=1 Tax=Tenacibaculum platacis TaxID=3137852 RepID=UPI0032B2BF01